MEQLVASLTVHLAWLTEAIAAAVIAVGALRAVIAVAVAWLRERGEDVPPSSIRLALGRSLALALEFLLGADILRTAVAPTWNDIGQLAAIAILRTALNWSLERELGAAERRERVPVAPRGDGDTPPIASATTAAR